MAIKVPTPDIHVLGKLEQKKKTCIAQRTLHYW